MKERSPLTRADQITEPLLIGQGANDPRVKQAESDQIVHAMKENDIPVTYVLYPDEGHGFQMPENNLSFFAVAEAFLAECQGGRFQPPGDDFVNSSIQVPYGVDFVPGHFWGDDVGGEVSDTPAGNDFVAVSAGAGFSVVLKADTSVVAWGGSYATLAVPEAIGFVAIAAGDSHVVALWLSQVEDIAALSDLVDELVVLGAILPANGQSLQAKLDTALAALPEDPAGATAALQAFIYQVRAFVRTGKLSPADGQALIDAAQAIMDALSA